MNNSERRIGNCLCGVVEISVDMSKDDVGACYCKNCKKWCGGPFMELECGIDVSISGNENISTFKSSSWAERGFCKICGSHIYIKDLRDGSYGIPPSLFSDDVGLNFKRQVFSDQKPEFYSFSNETLDITSNFIYEHHPETKENM